MLEAKLCLHKQVQHDGVRPASTRTEIGTLFDLLTTALMFHAASVRRAGAAGVVAA